MAFKTYSLSLLKTMTCIHIAQIKLISPRTYQKTVNVFWASNQHGEISKLFRQRQENLVFIIDGV